MSEKLLEKQIEAVLLYKNEPVELGELIEVLGASQEEVLATLEQLSKNMAHRGIVLVAHNSSYSLATSPDTADIIEKMVKDELNRDLSAASLETLSIIAYKGSVTRKEIEYIRGVNASFSLRNLLIRGLIERETSVLDERIFLYKPSTNLLLHLGISSLAELPEWSRMQGELQKAEETVKEVEVGETQE